MKPVNLSDHYWIVGGSITQVWSSAARAYVPISNAAYLTWLAADHFPPFKVATEVEIWDLLVQQAPDIAALVPAAMDKLKDSEIVRWTNGPSGLAVLAKVLLNHENRIRVLAGQPTITMAQFKTGIKALI